MASSQLTNYLRSNRKRLGLSQDEVSFLLGTKGESKVSRYERFNREPSLKTALALEAIFQRPVRELFGGLYQKAEQQVTERAKILNEKVASQTANPKTLRKRQILSNIAEHNIP
jgi:transcriptional regulator with XRE-family HTH domain